MDLHPPSLRSAAGQQMAEHAVAGELHLQQCARCNTVQYPPREVCGHCLADQLTWQRQSPDGVVLASSPLHNSLEGYFQEQLPWTLASVQLDCGPVVLVQLRADPAALSRVQVTHQQQVGGSWILQAVPTNPEAV